MSNLRIGIDARYISSRYSGIGIYSENLLRALARLDSPYQYVVFTHSSLDRDLALPASFEIVPLDWRPLSGGTIFGGVCGAYEDARLDLLHCHFPVLPYRWRGPTILTVHDLQPFSVPQFTGGRFYPVRKAYDIFYRWAYPTAFAKAHVLVTPSQATLDTMYKIFPEAARRTLVVPSGLDDAYDEPPIPAEQCENVRLKYRLAERFALYIGSTRPNKNIPNMLTGFARYVEQSNDREAQFVLVLAKDRFFRDVERTLAMLGNPKWARIVDQVSGAEKRAIYQMATAMLFATKSEGFGFPALEAQASGCPVIVADEAALPEVVGDSGLYADPDDPGDIALAIDALLRDAAVRAEMIRRGRVNCKRFSWDRCATRIHEIYRNMFDPEYYLASDQLEAIQTGSSTISKQLPTS